MELLRTRLCEWTPVGIDALALAPVVPGAVAAAPRLAVGRSNGALELWDTDTWHLRCSSPGRARRSIRSIVWVVEPGEKGKEPELRLISAGLHREVTEWDLETLEPLESVSSGGGAVWALGVQRNRVFAACDDGSVRVISLEGGPGSMMYQRRINVAKARLLSLAMQEDFLFAGGSESRITKWSIDAGVCEGSMQVEKSRDSQTLIWSLVALQENTLASGDSLGLVLIWDTVSCVVLHRFAQHQADVLALAASSSGYTLLSGSVDAKIAEFAFQPGSQEHWVFRNATFCHRHDIRAIAVDNAATQGSKTLFVSGGVAGKLFVHAPSATGKSGRPLQCSSFSPLFQVASVAEESRLLLCQKSQHLELWYLQELKEALKLEGDGSEANSDLQNMPEAQLLLRMSLSSDPARGEPSSNHLCASAIAPDGTRLAASDMEGTRLFHLTVGELQVRQENALPKELRSMPARALLFCGSGLLAMAHWRGHCISLLDCAQLTIAATFKHEHKAPVSMLSAGGPGNEWLASADLAGAVHVFSLDGLQHHARVPVGAAGGIPTAMGFDGPGKHLVVVSSTHAITLFDVEAQTLAAGVPCPISIPTRLVSSQARVCGVAAPSKAPGKLLLWGHSFMLSLSLSPATEDEASGEPCSWKIYAGIRHVLALTALDEAKWGAPLSSEAARAAVAGEGKPKKKRKSNSGAARPIDSKAAMVVSLEVSPDAAERSLPLSFERKKFLKKK